MFSLQHLMVVTVFVIFGVTLISWAKKQSEPIQIKVGNYFAYALSISIIIWTILKILDRGFDINHDLPFHLCNFIALFIPIFSRTRKFLLYEILLFWILAGTSQAVITPDLKHSFPHYIFLKYWFVHAGLIVFILYATIIYKMKPTLKSVFKSFLTIQGYFVLMLIINKITDSNYFYISKKPEGATVLNYLGDWPYYIFSVELVLLPYFLLIYLPFYLTNRKKQQ